MLQRWEGFKRGLALISLVKSAPAVGTHTKRTLAGEKVPGDKEAPCVLPMDGGRPC